MQFDDHEIWGAPVHAVEASDIPVAALEVPAPALATAGRLYRSAGSEAHPDAVVALPNHQRRHTAVTPAEATSWSNTGVHPAISINSLIPPRPAQIEDPAIAEVLGARTPAPAPAPLESEATHGFTGWFRQATGFAPEPAATVTATAMAPRAPRANLHMPDARGAAKALSGAVLSARTFAALAFVITSVVAILNTRLAGSPGTGTGVALVLITAYAGWALGPGSRWAAWVLPPYLLMAAIVVSGQVGSSAPGRSISGQALLVLSGLITLAPWLAAASLLGVLVPLLHRARP
ncbi:MAG: hypothetical protein ACYC3W_08245 [Candidatus Nanopelagicales bacterium]